MPEPADHVQIPEVQSPPPVPDFRFGDLQKGDRIGTGGDADVYRATIDHDGNTYTVAVKEPRFEGTIQKRAFEKFQTESETWSRLSDHDNIVTVYAWGDEPLPWLGLEFMDGGTLESKIGTLEIAEALWLSGRIAEGVRHGHRHGIAHLDLKPTNVLLRNTPSGKWDYPKVSDWGLARMLLEHSNSVEGISPTYAAPEQFDPDTFGDPDDFTDIYQLGTVVYALLAGEPPFTGPSTTVMRNVLEDKPDPPSAVNPGLPDAVDRTILKALAKQKDERYESVVVFRQELDRLFQKFTDAHGETTPSETGQSDSRGGTTVAGTSEDPGLDSTEREPAAEPTEPTRTARSTDRSVDSSAGSHAQETSDQNAGAVVTRRRALGVLGVGVVGLGGGWMATQMSDTDRDTAGGTGPSGTETVTEDTISDDYQFSQGEMYRYEGVWSGQDSTLIWDVIAAGTDSVEVQIGSDSETYAIINSTHTDIFADAIDRVGPIIGSIRVPVDASSGGELSVGESWTGSVDERLLGGGEPVGTDVTETSTVNEESVGIEVIETSTVNNVSCTRVSVDETPSESVYNAYEACVAPGYPLVLSYDGSFDSGGYKLELTEANRP